MRQANEKKFPKLYM